MNRAVMMETTSCGVCAQSFQVLAMTPCVHFLCADCVELSLGYCGACREGYDIDDFQTLQPGFDTQWQWNLDGEKAKRDRELAAVRSLRSAQGGGVGHAPPNGVALAAAPNIPQAPVNAAAMAQAAAVAARQRSHRCTFSRAAPGLCIVCEKEHWDGCMMTCDSPCPVCHRESKEVPKEEVSRPARVAEE